MRRDASKAALLADHLGRCGDAAYNAAYRLTGNDSDARDLVQQAAVKALSHFDQFDRARSFEPWFFTILHHVFLDTVKRYDRRHVVSLDAETLLEGASWTDILPSREPGPLEELDQKELEETMQRSLNRLPADYRAAVVLSDIEGFAYDEIAAITDSPVGTVRSRIHRGRAMLRKMLETYQMAGEVRPS